MSAIAHATLRANPRYELVQLDRLEAVDREPGEADGELYGVLRSRSGGGLDPLAVSPDTALLFMTLTDPRPLPGYVRARLGHATDGAVASLVLDGVLEIEHDGDYVCGPPAAEVLMPDGPAVRRDRIGELSVAALRYGEALPALPDGLLALRLYCYGRQPVAAALARRLPDGPAIDAHLGIGDGGPARAALDGSWVATSAGENAHWRSWRARRAPRGSGAGYKLYVSPDLDAVAPALEAVAGRLANRHGVMAFKVGGNLAGLCRPDKLIVYFDRLEDLHDGAALLRSELDGCPVHGVPFTAAVTRDGLLSWGGDPPVAGAATTSWRLWVSERLAEFLLAGRGGDRPPWRYALARLRLAGVDTDTWIPDGRIWASGSLR